MNAITKRTSPKRATRIGEVQKNESDTPFYAFEGDIRFRPVCPDGGGMRVTDKGVFYGKIRDSDTYVRGSCTFNGCPIYTAKGETLEEDAAIADMFVYSGIFVAETAFLKKRQDDDPEVCNRLAKITEGACLEDLIKIMGRRQEAEKKEAKRCRKEVRKAVKQHATPETIEELRWEAHRHAVISKEHRKAQIIIHPLAIAVAEARKKLMEGRAEVEKECADAREKTKFTSRRNDEVELALLHAARAEHAATQAHITVCTLLSDAAAQNRAGSCPPPDNGTKLSVFSKLTGEAVA